MTDHSIKGQVFNLSGGNHNPLRVPILTRAHKRRHKRCLLGNGLSKWVQPMRWWVTRSEAGVTSWFQQEQQGCHSRKEERMRVSGQHLPKLVQEEGLGCWSFLRKCFCSGTDSVGLGNKTMQGSRKGAGSFWLFSPSLAPALSLSFPTALLAVNLRFRV